MKTTNADSNNRILVIDDSRAIHVDFRKILSPSHGADQALETAEAALFDEPAKARPRVEFEITSAYQGQEALTLVQQSRQEGHPFATAFVDVRMPPGWDGIETIQKLWEVDPDLQIAICTAHSDYSWGEMLNKLGLTDRLLILKKPFDTVEVLQLACALTEKWRLTQVARQKLDALDHRVRESEEQFRCLSACSPVGILMADTSGRCTYANPHCRAIFGRNSLMSFLGDGWLSFVHPQERAAVAAEWVACVQNRQGFRREVRLQRRSDEVHWVQMQSAVMTADAGAVIGQVLSIADTTELRRAAEVVRHSEEHFRTLIENASDIIAIVDSGGKIRYESPAVERVLGYRPEELTGKDAFALIHPDDRDRVLQVFATVLHQRGLTATVECRFHRKDGTWRVMESIGKNLAEHETIQGVIMTSRDITDYRQAAEELHLRGTALAAAVNAIVITDNHGQIEWVNPAFTHMTGYSVAEAIGQTPGILKSGEHEPAFYHQLWQTINAGQPWHGEMINRRKDGSLYTEEMTVTPVRDEQGAIRHFVAIKQDITEKQRLEQQYRQAQKMEIVGRLAGGVAHDFNNLLTAILGYSEMMLKRIQPGDPSHAHADEVRKAAERAASLTRQLLAFSRQQVLQPQVLDLNTVVTDMEKMLHRLIGEDIELHTRLAQQLGGTRADRGQIEQLILNLAVNARDAMPDGGALTIETGEVNVEQPDNGVKPGRYVTLTVTDTGTGMTEEVKAHLFEPFFTTKEPGKGTGLGLATCYGIVQQDGGHIAVHSELDKGSRFVIYLPQGEAPAPDASHPAGPAQPGPAPAGRETVLVVEDESVLRQLACSQLRGLGYTVLEASNGSEAFREIEQRNGHGIDLLITDVIMPQMGGKELAECVGKKYPTLKVLFTSGYTDHAFDDAPPTAAAAVFLQKPFTGAMLAGKVRGLLDARN